MRNRSAMRGVPDLLTAALVTFAAACDESISSPTSDARVVGGNAARGARPFASVAKTLDVERCAPSAGGFTIAFTNQYFPAPLGRQWVYEGEDDGETTRLQITVLDRTRLIAGVITRVIEEREWVDGELLEVSWNYYAQASDGSVCYFGEDVDIYEDGGVVHDGAWCTTTPGHRPGIFMPADPQPGMTFQMEVAPGIAEDQGKIVGIGPTVVPAGLYTETIRVRESNPLDGGKGYKVFAAGTGLIVDGPAELIAVKQTLAVPQPPLVEQVCGTAA